MKPEEKARQQIDQLLEAAGWNIQDLRDLNLGASLGVAVREFPLKSGAADYLNFVDRKAVGVVEANIETLFRDTRDPDTRSRRIFAFHKPETLKQLSLQEETLRARLKKMPSTVHLNKEGLRDCQFEAIQNLEQSFAEARPRALIQMATGSGKTYTAVSFIYRLIKFAGAKRVLFLVDRSNLGRQTKKEFQQYVTPDDGRKFTELYNVQHLTSNTIDPVSKVCITTIQRLYSMLRGETEFEPENEELSLFEISPDGAEKEVYYNPQIPIETFDFIVTDECHRSIYGLWRQVLEYFDAFLIGLTATPSKQTLGFFNQNLIMEYSHERAVADGVNVGYEVYRIKTDISEKGGKVEAGDFVDKRDKLTRKVRWEQLDEPIEYTSDHVEDIVHIMREEFGKGNDFCKKITYKTEGAKPEDLIASFRNSYNPRIAMTVDMISTGTDIKPLECLLFMRDVKSRVLFEQMKGRGTRTISSTDFKAITPGASTKTHFMIVDAVGVCENDKTDSRPLERKKSVAFDKLIMSVALGNRDEDTITSLVGRLARMDREIEEKDRKEIQKAAYGKSLKEIINNLLDAVDPDKKFEKAKEIFKTETPTGNEIKESGAELAKNACAPFDVPKLRNAIIDIKKRNEQIIDTVSKDNVIFSGFDEQAKIKARSIVDTFKKFIEENRDEITALQIIYSKPYGSRHLTYEEIKEIAEAIKKPPYHLTPELLWQAYEQLDRSKVRGAGAQKLLTDIISLIRFAAGNSDILEPFPETVNQRFERWRSEQEIAGVRFTKAQTEWLVMIKDHIASSLGIEIGDFENVPFNQKGGAVRAYQLFGKGSDNILEELNEVLAV